MPLAMFVVGAEFRLFRLFVSGDLGTTLSIVVERPAEALSFLRWYYRPLTSAKSAETLLYLRKRSPDSALKVRVKAG